MRADGVGFGDQQRADAVEHGGGRNVRRCALRCIPSDLRGVGTGGGVGVLTGDELEGVDGLGCELMAEIQLVVGANFFDRGEWRRCCR